MKPLKLLSFTLSMLVLVSCNKQETSTEYGYHFFYIENATDTDTNLLISNTSCLESELSDDYRINDYYNIYLPAGQTTLVRVLKSKGEVLNCMYYTDILKSRPAANIAGIEEGYLYFSEGWQFRDYKWAYHEKDKYHAEYTLTINRQFFDELFH